VVRIQDLDFPDELYYSDYHMWVRCIDDNKVQIGLSDLGQAAAGKIRFVRFFPKGRSVQKEKTMGTIETGKWVGPLRAPLSGKIVSVNLNVRKKPVLINDAPYDEGWLFEIEPSDLKNEISLLRRTNAPDFKDWVEKEIKDKVKI
jgi:glycine cleavage system H protein